MFAIIETGGKQYRVEEGLELNVDLLKIDAGAKLSIDSVLLVEKDGDTKIGEPYVKGAMVECDVLGHIRGKKVVVFHKLPKKDSRKTQGHRQDYTSIKVKSIKA